MRVLHASVLSLLVALATTTTTAFVIPTTQQVPSISNSALEQYGTGRDGAWWDRESRPGYRSNRRYYTNNNNYRVREVGAAAYDYISVASCNLVRFNHFSCFIHNYEARFILVFKLSSSKTSHVFRFIKGDLKLVWPFDIPKLWFRSPWTLNFPSERQL